MAGLSSKALAFGEPENKKKYNGIEFENVLGIDEYEAQLRNLDPQVGRWWEIDPKIENQEIWSPYVSNNDNPIQFADPLGDEADECCRGFFEAVTGFLGGAKDGAKSTVAGAGQQANGIIEAFTNPSINGLMRISPVGLVTGGSPEDIVNSFKGTIETARELKSELKSGNIGDVSHAAGFITEKIAELYIFKKVAGGEKSGITFEASSKGLGNPFKGSTLSEVRSSFEKRVEKGTMQAKGPNAFVNLKSKYSYNLDKGGFYGRKGKIYEAPHVDVNYPNPKPLNVPPKKKLETK